MYALFELWTFSGIFWLVRCFKRGVSNLRIMHREQPLWLLTVGQAGLPQLLVNVQPHHYLPDVSVPLPHTVDLLHLLPVQGLKVSIERCLDAINCILHLEWRKKIFVIMMKITMHDSNSSLILSLPSIFTLSLPLFDPCFLFGNCIGNFCVFLEKCCMIYNTFDEFQQFLNMFVPVAELSGWSSAL